MATKEIKIPNIGDASDVEVIEVLVSPGDKVNKEDSLITLESDKASMEIPSPEQGTIESVLVKVGDKVSEGTVIVTLKTSLETKQESKEAETVTVEATPSKTSSEEKTTSSSPSAPTEKKVTIPDIGDAKDVEVIEILVQPGSQVKKDESLITLEGEKATMEIPSPYSGEVKNISIRVGDKVSKGHEILTMSVLEDLETPQKTESKEKEVPSTKPEPAITKQTEAPPSAVPTSDHSIHAGPAVRRLAREFGINLNQVKGTGPKNRILKEDLQNFVKTALSQGVTASSGLQVPKMPEIDFSKYGEIETVPLNKIKKLTGVNVHRSWVTIPHVTQFGQADITDLEEFRKSHKEQIEKEGVKLTPLVFIMKAVVASLKEFPHFNASLDAKGENLVLKKFYNLGIAVDTPNGLVVPVIKDVDQKTTLEIAKELADVSQKARLKGLSPLEMSGGCFTISSLGGIGGTAFTPIINSPEVAILGVSRSAITPQYIEEKFVPRLMLPLSLSYDHRVIDGADGARFLVFLANCISDIRTLLL